LILSKEGILSWFIDLFHMNSALDWVLSLPGIGGSSLSLSPIGMFIAFCYIWLPFMIVPIQASLERVPKSVIEASGDLGANPSQTFRNIIFPLSLPGVIAGSIFTFSLTLGDFIIPQVLGTSRFFIGQAVYSHQGTSGNIPLAAAFTMGPVVIMIIYMLIARRLGAFDAL
jgi:putative spermidine/putrescine transport system permease protein